jgi:hypothetical protein
MSRDAAADDLRGCPGELSERAPFSLDRIAWTDYSGTGGLGPN